MKIKLVSILAVIAIIAVIVVAVVMNQKPKTNLEPITSAEDLTQLISKVYEGQDGELLQSLYTQEIELDDTYMVNKTTGLENADNLEFIVASEPMMTSQAYSFVLVKVKDGVDANAVAKEMSEKINPSKWICVTAEKIYATNSGDVVCLIMASEEMGKPIYESFKALAGYVGEEYEKTQTI